MKTHQMNYVRQRTEKKVYFHCHLSSNMSEEKTIYNTSIEEPKQNDVPYCEHCGFCLVDSSQATCNCGKYSW